MHENFPTADREARAIATACRDLTNIRLFFLAHKVRQAASESANKQHGRDEHPDDVAIKIAQTRSEGAAVALESQQHPGQEERESKLDERVPPCARAIGEVGIMASLPQAAHPQDGKTEKDQRKVARIEPEGRDGQGEAKERLHRIRQDGDRKK